MSDGTVTLITGEVVASDSEAWRAECEARHVLRIRHKARRHEYLNRVEDRRGKASRDKLFTDVMALWNALRGDVVESR